MENLSVLETRNIKNHNFEKNLIQDKNRQLQNSLIYPNYVGYISTKKPAYLEIIEDSVGKENLVISSFDPMRDYNAIKVVPQVGNIFNKDLQNTIEVKKINSNIRWPNNITPVNRKTFGKEGFLVASGFILYPSNTGEVSFVDIKTGTKEKLTKDKKGWFYHTAIPYDLKKDGSYGVLTARSNKSVINLRPEGELVWLERPKIRGDEWKEHILTKGPDVHFDICDINGDGKDEIVAGEFFNDKLSFFWQENGALKKRIIEKGLHNPFDVDFVDINRDGKKEILVTNHAKRGSVFVYEIPNDIKNGDFIKHEILSNIKPRNKMPNEFAPGRAMAFYPQKGMKGKPYILVSGDASGKVHLLTPKQPLNTKNWDYDETILLSENSTIGKIKIKNDEEGYARIYVPLYDKDVIRIFTYNDDFKKEGRDHEKNINSVYRRHNWNEKR